jgi:Fe(3+) dicitrate transport protein
MGRSFSIFLFIFFPALLIAQQNETGSITGTVTGYQGERLGSVNVGLTGTTFGTSTSADGTFEITDIPAGEYELLATFIGYEEVSKEIVVYPGETIHMDISLRARHYNMPQVNIFADRVEGIFETVPGSLSFLNKREIDHLNPVNINEVLRRSPGVHVVEEEGVGMRMNFAIRGLDAARSRSTLMLEDGIPLALAPYGEPEMYYAPVMEKISGVEILKGSGSVLYGPQTIGGVVNFITKDPPAESTGELSLTVGESGYFSGLLSYGNTFGDAGLQVNYIRKQADNIGPTMFRINDLSSKFKLQLNNQSYLGVKLGLFDESSNSTYVGMTQPMFDSGEYDFVRISPYDRLNVNRYNVSATHDYFYSDDTQLTTTIFGYTTTRNWQRQDFTYNSFDDNGNPNPLPDTFAGVTWGDESVEQGAIYLLNSSGNRNRSYDIAGGESRFTARYNFIGLENNEVTGGVRYLFERAFEKRINGSRPNATSGEIMNDEIRTGHGISAYIHNRFNFSDSFSISGGVRMERFADERDIRRSVFTINNERQVRDTSIVASNSLIEFIPGAGFNLKVTEQIGIFGGIHRGFAPPRTKDAISNTGEIHELAAEKSWNYELGLRANTTRGLNIEFTAYYLDFSNQVIPVAEHAGGVGAGVTNAGATFHRGVEIGAVLDLGVLFDWQSFGLVYDLNVGYVEARFNSDRFIEDGEGGKVNVNGNRTPYAPEWLVSTALTLEHKAGLSARITGRYTSGQFSDPLNRITPLNHGRDGLIPSHQVIDLSLKYHLSRINTTINVGFKNILNERYITSRRPQGIMIGTPRLFTAGVSYNF